jgi:hypothetical protein
LTFESGSKLTRMKNLTIRDCLSLQEIHIPASVEIIGNECFRGCRRLSSVIFESESKLTQIGENVFKGCASMRSLMIPRSFLSVPKEWGWKWGSCAVRREPVALVPPPPRTVAKPRVNKRRK